MDDVPHIALPIRIAGSSYVINQQDTLDELVANVTVIASFEIGYREDKPDFGIPGMAPADRPLNLHVIEDACEAWEPRAQVHASEAPVDPLDPLADRVRLTVSMARSNEE